MQQSPNTRRRLTRRREIKGRPERREKAGCVGEEEGGVWARRRAVCGRGGGRCVGKESLVKLLEEFVVEERQSILLVLVREEQQRHKRTHDDDPLGYSRDDGLPQAL